jgi:hypothetical protein
MRHSLSNTRGLQQKHRGRGMKAGHASSSSSSSSTSSTSTSTSSHFPPEYMEGLLWKKPDTLALGPGHLSVLCVFLTQQVTYIGPQLTEEACITALTILASLIPLAAAMVEEAAQPSFEARLTTDAATFKSFCYTCSHLLWATSEILSLVLCLIENEPQAQQSIDVDDKDQQGTQELGSTQSGVSCVEGADVDHSSAGDPADQGNAPGSGQKHTVVRQSPTGSGGSDATPGAKHTAASPQRAPAQQDVGPEAMQGGCDHPATFYQPPVTEPEVSLGSEESTICPPFTQQAALLLPVLASSALQLVHLTTTCTWHVREAVRSADCQQLLCSDNGSMNHLSDLEMHSIRALNSLLRLGELACQGSASVDITANRQHAPGADQQATLGRVLHQLLPSFGRQCLGVCIASHLSESCGELLAAMVGACSTRNTRVTSSSSAAAAVAAAAAAERQPLHGHVDQEAEQCHSSKPSSASAAHAKTAAGGATPADNIPAVATQKVSDYINVTHLQELADAAASLAHILHLCQGNLQPWMGAALGGHISRSYDPQQLCISMVPMLSGSSFQAPAYDPSIDGGQLSALLDPAALALPLMILTFKAAQAQPASHARGPPQVAGGRSSSSSSSSRRATTNEADAGISRGLRAHLWELMSQQTSIPQLLAMRKNDTSGYCGGKCFHYMLEAVSQHLAPNGVLPQLNASCLSSPASTGSIGTAAPDAHPAAPHSQPAATSSTAAAQKDGDTSDAIPSFWFTPSFLHVGNQGTLTRRRLMHNGAHSIQRHCRRW